MSAVSTDLIERLTEHRQQAIHQRQVIGGELANVKVGGRKQETS
jgi:hypothetical protein